MELEGKVCLITGGSSGIGAATAREFACRGADIAICGLPADDSLAQDLKQEIERLGRRALTITADVSDRNESVRCVQQTLAIVEYLDMLVPCAGGPANGGRYPCTCRLPSRPGGGPYDAGARRRRHSADFLGGGRARLCRCDCLRRGEGAIPQFTRALARALADANIRVDAFPRGLSAPGSRITSPPNRWRTTPVIAFPCIAKAGRRRWQRRWPRWWKTISSRARTSR